MKPISAQASTVMYDVHRYVLFSPSWGGPIGGAAVRVAFACNTPASSAQRAIRAASAYNKRASTRPTVFGVAHALPCRPLRNSTETGGEGPKFFAGRGELFRLVARFVQKDTSARHVTCR
jgi:hypothetical protein